MTIREQVQDALSQSYPENLTNWTLSRSLNIPEASVRRATRELLSSAAIRAVGIGFAGATLYQGMPKNRAVVAVGR